MMSSSTMIHPTGIEAEGFDHGNGEAKGFKLVLGDIDLFVFTNDHHTYTTPEEKVTAEDMVKALHKAANDLAHIIRKEAQA